MALKISIREDSTGEKHINPDVMDLLKEFSDHAEFCGPCGLIKAGHSKGPYCSLGDQIMTRLLAHPDVEWVPEDAE